MRNRVLSELIGHFWFYTVLENKSIFLQHYFGFRGYFHSPLRRVPLEISSNKLAFCEMQKVFNEMRKSLTVIEKEDWKRTGRGKAVGWKGDLVRWKDWRLCRIEERWERIERVVIDDAQWAENIRWQVQLRCHECAICIWHSPHIPTMVMASTHQVATSESLNLFSFVS